MHICIQYMYIYSLLKLFKYSYSKRKIKRNQSRARYVSQFLDTSNIFTLTCSR